MAETLNISEPSSRPHLSATPGPYNGPQKIIGTLFMSNGLLQNIGLLPGQP
jgi:hypothetical protein